MGECVGKRACEFEREKKIIFYPQKIRVYKISLNSPKTHAGCGFILVGSLIIFIIRNLVDGFFDFFKSHLEQS